MDNSRSDLAKAAVVGRFKTGKSCIINALVGQGELPTNVSECTGKPVLVRFGKHRAAWRCIPDKSCEQIPWEEFIHIVDLTMSGSDGGDDALGETASYAVTITGTALACAIWLPVFTIPPGTPSYRPMGLALLCFVIGAVSTVLAAAVRPSSCTR